MPTVLEGWAPLGAISARELAAVEAVLGECSVPTKDASAIAIAKVCGVELIIDTNAPRIFLVKRETFLLRNFHEAFDDTISSKRTCLCCDYATTSRDRYTVCIQ